MMTKAEEKFGEWKRYADEDEQIAEIAIREEGPPNQICFHSQQMAEKYLKGFLVFAKKRFEKRHQLDFLLNLCEKEDASFSELAEEVGYLADFYVETRYPGDIPEFSLIECEKAFEAAKRIKEFVLDKIKK